MTSTWKKQWAPNEFPGIDSCVFHPARFNKAQTEFRQKANPIIEILNGNDTLALHDR